MAAMKPFPLTAIVIPLLASPVQGEDGGAGLSAEWGLTVRSRGEDYRGQPFGPQGPGDDDYLLWRVLGDAELSAGERWAAHVQLGWHEQSGRDRAPAPTDEDGVDVRQAYLEVQVADGLRLRAGRQELALGSARLVSTRDGPNLRRSFQGVHAGLRRGPWTSQAFVVQPLEDRADSFDNRPDDAQLFGGLYVTRADQRGGMDIYYLVLDREEAQFGSTTADELRHSVGVRAFGQSGAFDHNFEAVLQWGSFGSDSIRAGTLASDTGITLEGLRFKPRLGLKLNVTSGDKDPADGRLGTFNPLFPNLAYFNDAALLAPQNHVDVHPELTLALRETLQVTAGVDWFWKARRADDIYRGPGQPVGAEEGSRTVGRQADLTLRWRPMESLEIKGTYVRFDVGTALRAIGGEDTNFFMVSLQGTF